MAESFESAEVVRDKSGRQYHIGLKPGDVAPYVVLVGDPARTAKAAALLDRVRLRRESREFRTVTGFYKGLPVTVMSTGIGCDNMEIAIVELLQVVERPTIIRAGSCGALQPGMNLGDLIISTGAVRLEDTSSWFAPEGYPAVANGEIVLALVEAARALEYPHHAGLTATASGFYGAQGRKVPNFEPLFPDLPDRMARLRVANFEMETSTLLTLAGIAGVRAGTVCAVYAQRVANVFIDGDTKRKAEKTCLRASLDALRIVERMDRARGAAPIWAPSMGLAPAIVPPPRPRKPKAPAKPRARRA